MPAPYFKGLTLATKAVRPLPYYGGKAKSKGQWVSNLIPWEKKTLYVEPFCGMANVWAARNPVQAEILNDLNHRVINWWEVLRDQPRRVRYFVARYAVLAGGLRGLPSPHG